MRVLIGCEFSAVVRDAFRARGHDAWSCDVVATEGDPIRCPSSGPSIAMLTIPRVCATP
jgi:hypothetical protein